MLQRTLLKRLVDLPKSIEGLMTKDTYDKARAYALHRNTFGTVQDVYSKIYNTVSVTTLLQILYTVDENRRKFCLHY